MKIALVSAEDEKAWFLRDVMLRNGFSVSLDGTQSIQEIEALSRDADFIVLNHTTSMNRRIIDNLDQREKVIELSLAKAPMKRYSGSIISLSLIDRKLPDGRFEMVPVLITDISREGSGDALDTILAGKDYLTMESGEHDKIVAEVLVKPYIISLLARKVTKPDQELFSREYGRILELSKSVTNYNINHIRDIIRNNPNSGDVFGKMEENLKRVWNELSFY